MQRWAKTYMGSSGWQTFEQIEQEFSSDRVSEIFRLLQSQPLLLTHLWVQFHDLVLQGALPRVLKEMVGLVVATTTRCDHIRMVLLDSLTQQAAEQTTLAAIAQGDYKAADVSHVTRSILWYVDLAIAHRPDAGAQRTDRLAQHQTTQALNDTGLEEREQLELMATIALFEQLCTAANLLQLEPDASSNAAKLL